MALRDERRPPKKAALERLKPESGGALEPSLVTPLVQVWKVVLWVLVSAQALGHNSPIKVHFTSSLAKCHL